MNSFRVHGDIDFLLRYFIEVLPLVLRLHTAVQKVDFQHQTTFYGQRGKKAEKAQIHDFFVLVIKEACHIIQAIYAKLLMLLDIIQMV